MLLTKRLWFLDQYDRQKWGCWVLTNCTPSEDLSRIDSRNSSIQLCLWCGFVRPIECRKGLSSSNKTWNVNLHIISKEPIARGPIRHTSGKCSALNPASSTVTVTRGFSERRLATVRPLEGSTRGCTMVEKHTRSPHPQPQSLPCPECRFGSVVELPALLSSSIAVYLLSRTSTSRVHSVAQQSTVRTRTGAIEAWLGGESS